VAALLTAAERPRTDWRNAIMAATGRCKSEGEILKQKMNLIVKLLHDDLWFYMGIDDGIWWASLIKQKSKKSWSDKSEYYIRTWKRANGGLWKGNHMIL
jgi:hypothetical protein